MKGTFIVKKIAILYILTHLELKVSSDRAHQDLQFCFSGYPLGFTNKSPEPIFQFFCCCYFYHIKLTTDTENIGT